MTRVAGLRDGGALAALGTEDGLTGSAYCSWPPASIWSMTSRRATSATPWASAAAKESRASSLMVQKRSSWMVLRAGGGRGR